MLKPPQELHMRTVIMDWNESHAYLRKDAALISPN